MLWLEGEVVAETVAPFDLRDRGLLLADGLFETVLVLGGVPIYGDFHLDRLMAGAAALGIDVERARVAAALGDLAAAAEGHGVVRVTVTRGAGARGLAPSPGARPTVFGTLSPWSPQVAFAPVALATSQVRRNATSPASRLKTLAYLDNVLALDAAKREGADDALILSTNGGVACTSMANLFAVLQDELVTPPCVRRRPERHGPRPAAGARGGCGARSRRAVVVAGGARRRGRRLRDEQRPARLAGDGGRRAPVPAGRAGGRAPGGAPLRGDRRGKRGRSPQRLSGQPLFLRPAEMPLMVIWMPRSVWASESAVRCFLRSSTCRWLSGSR